MNDIAWMQEALKEAARGGWSVHPNPMVGAVIVKDGRELGRGYHHGVGQAHAEVEALQNAATRRNDVNGATIYVTLEPCNHYGHTPPCTEALINAGIKRCVIAALDPNKKVKGGGIARLREAGIQCDLGICQNDVLALNAPFFTRTTLNRPFITCKWAMTADGKTATVTGNSQWVTSPESREDVHCERGRHDAILVGTQTIIADDPQLNVRLEGYTGRQPVRVILDRTLRIPKNYRIWNTKFQKTLLFTSAKNIENNSDLSFYTNNGVDVHPIDENNSILDLEQVLQILADNYSITTLYCEGGNRLHGALHDMGAIDQVDIYIAPKIVGGNNAFGCVGGNGIEWMDDATQLKIRDVQRIGPDICIRAMVIS